MSATRLHGTCVALHAVAALLTGRPGSGKSDLALRFCALGPGHRLVADDQVLLRETGGRLLATAPPALAGLIEVRGLGVLPAETCAEAELRLVIRLDADALPPRLPPDPLARVTLAGIELPQLDLAAFEPSAHLKLALALTYFA